MRPAGTYRRSIQKKKRGFTTQNFIYDINTPPCLTYEGVQGFLGQVPLGRNRGRDWTHFDVIFELLWSPRIPVLSARTKKTDRGWKKTYLEAYHKALDLLFESDIRSRTPDSLQGRLRRKVKDAFEYYCTCIPGTSKDKWLMPNNANNELTWFCFQLENGE